jgi:lipopolysaccharide assembly protein A
MRLLIAAPFLLLLVLFALTNRAPVTLGLWPTGISLQAPLSLVVLGAAGLAFLAGGVVVWVNELGQRRRARRAEALVLKLEEEVQALRTRLGIAAPGGTGAATALPPPEAR